MDHRHCFMTNVGVSGRVAEIDMGVEQVAQTEMLGQRRGLDQPCVSDQARIIEDHFDRVQGVRGWHRKGVLRLRVNDRLRNRHSPSSGHVFREYPPRPTTTYRWIRVKALIGGPPVVT